MNASISDLDLESLQVEFKQELVALADWWVEHSIDHKYGGFLGEINNANEVNIVANKGVILNARILWFFSAVSNQIKDARYRDCADRAYKFLINHFFDIHDGGFYWELDFSGDVLNDKKQVYAQAFVIYALSEYYRLTKDQRVLAHALRCFDLLETHAVDKEREGYLEAFSRAWLPIEDVRLSEKDLNFPKTQNTHLHILEAYTSLHNVYPILKIKDALVYNIQLFDKYMINKKTHHLRMFMDLDWNDCSSEITYGHDIEAGWLIAKALESSGERALMDAMTPTLLRIIDTTLEEARGSHGQIIDSYNSKTKTLNTDSVWWVQAEALVGFFYAFRTTHNGKYLAAAKSVWQFVKDYQIDKSNGEWFWLSTLDAPRADKYPKLGFWKCPYHNGRAMLESIHYLDR
jgi:mannobiose 2-epimerase